MVHPHSNFQALTHNNCYTQWRIYGKAKWVIAPPPQTESRQATAIFLIVYKNSTFCWPKVFAPQTEILDPPLVTRFHYFSTKWLPVDQIEVRLTAV